MTREARPVGLTSRIGVLLATVGGLGYAPIAPGTFGSAAGVALYWFTRHWPVAWQLSLIAVVTIVGIWASTVAARHFDREDPGHVVIDEVAGQLVTLAFTGAGAAATVLAFFVFRIFDIVKPYPANRLEALHGGTGIMADDLMAGVYGCVVMHVVLRLVPWLQA
jgi:phosphatidylglycerophosphatase A